jgi:hypothetical protein
MPVASPSIPKTNAKNKPSHKSPGLDVALQSPRLHDSLQPNVTTLEYPEPAVGVLGFDNSTAAFLQERGHLLEWTRPKFSAAHLLRWDCQPVAGSEAEDEHECAFEAASEPRHLHSGARVW